MNTKERFSVYEIGKVEGKNKIIINKNFVKGLKYLSLFSHVIVIFSKEFMQKTIKVKDIDEKMGIITFCDDKDLETNVSIYDIKPYFPCEDRVKESINKFPRRDNKKVFVNSENEIAANGSLKKINGEDFIYIENDFENIYEELNGYSHIKIMWWFSNFDNRKYRRTTECNPPYENAPRTGIFASRSPVRPNPIALTTARILGFDRALKRIKVSKLDSFNNSPLIKIFPYISTRDKVSACSVPDWLEHWPEWFEEEVEKEYNSQVFIKQSSVYNILETLFEVGLGYIKLGQSSTTLSGGEAQRIKLSKELCLNDLRDCLYIFDEPTSGLHFSDIQNLLLLFDKIRNNGNTILIIEHNLDIIINSDWIIDLGPESGNLGGNVIMQGTVTNLIEADYGHTAKALKRLK